MKNKMRIFLKATAIIVVVSCFIMPNTLVFAKIYKDSVFDDVTPRTWYVDDDASPGGDGSFEHPFEHIQDGINATEDGDIVLVADGIYTGSGNKNLDFGGKAITVRSENGADNCIIDCEENGRGFYFNNGEIEMSVLAGFTIRNGYADKGGGIFCDISSPTISNCIITSNTADSAGGGFYCTDSNPIITNCIIINNTVMVAGDNGGGGGISCESYSEPLISNCTISENAVFQGDAWAGGGGIRCYDHSNPTIVNCTVRDNMALYCSSLAGGGGICFEECDVVIITDCLITGNTAIQDPLLRAPATGGGVLGAWSSNVSIANCIITGNIGDLGGGVCFDGCLNSTISNCTIAGNAGGAGGGMFLLRCTPIVTGCNIHGNTASDGAGIHAHDVTLIDCTIAENTASYSGGGIYCNAGTLRNCIIIENMALYCGMFGGGGGIYQKGYGGLLTIINCAITGNIAAASGGGILCSGDDSIILNCAIAANWAAEYGGGVYFVGVTNSALVNCIVTGNAADSAGGGVAAWVTFGVNLNNNILWGDSAPSGPEVALLEMGGNPASASISHSDVQGGETAAYIEDGCELIWGNGNIDADPQFIDPDNDDYHLRHRSPCIDSGNNNAVPPDITADLDGNPRFVDDPYVDDTGNGTAPIVDMGAYEFQPYPVDLDGDGDVDQSDLGILLAAYDSHPGDPHWDYRADIDGDDDVDQSDLGILLAYYGYGT